jgi:hypothetical protein
VTAGSSRDLCPRCSSERITAIASAQDDRQAGYLSADAPAASADPPNMCCEACGHRWWRAPRAAPMSEREEGVRE